MKDASPAHWASLARAWELTGPPLRPAAEDVAAYTRFAQGWKGPSAPRILLLGVTPEIYQIPWPAGHDFLAVDRGTAMITHVWPGSSGQVLHADWLDLPLPPASRDLVFCDGGLHLLAWPDRQQDLVRRLGSVVAPGGRCIFRIFTPPPLPEKPETVLADLLERRIPNLNVLKLRLGMALQASPAGGVAVHAMWRLLSDMCQGDWDGLASRLGWPPDELRVIEAYQDSPARYYFITREEVEALFRTDGLFRPGGASVSTGALGDRCPVMLFERS